jgi:hypothetical protein
MTERSGDKAPRERDFSNLFPGCIELYKINRLTTDVLALKPFFYFRLSSQDQIVYVAQNKSFREDLLLNHSFEVIWKLW